MEAPYIKLLDVHVYPRMYTVTNVTDISPHLIMHHVHYETGYVKGDSVSFRYMKAPVQVLSGKGIFRVRVAMVSFRELDGTFWPANEEGFDYLLSSVKPSRVYVPAGWHVAIVPLSDHSDYLLFESLDELTASKSWCPQTLTDIPARDLQWDYGWTEEVPDGHTTTTG